MGRTLAEKVWDDHVVRHADGEPDLLFIDLHLLHEVTSPQAFDGLRKAGRQVRRTDLTIATEDHNTPTLDIDKPIADPVSRTQLETLRKNCAEFGVRLHPLGDVEQGVVHVVGPQLGLTQPGTTVVCGDSHTSTHGAFGALAFGIGTSQVEHVLATQTLPLAPFKTMAVTVEGELPETVTAKDLILAIIARIGTGGGQGFVIEYRGEAIEKLSMEARMTVCNMSIEAGARAGMIAPDETTFAYLQGRPHAPQGEDWDAAVEYWRTLRSDDDAVFDREVVIDASELAPFVTWGTNPGQGAPLSESVPDPSTFEDASEKYARREGPGVHGSDGRVSRCAKSRWTPSSSVPAPTAASRTCAPPPRSCTAVRWPTGCGCWWSPVRCGSRSRPWRRGWTRCSPRPAPSGGTRAARCVWA
ncbi:3-isopropylmalate dehydratase, large subunit [Streptomyces himastatinicus ATCC 53653]|uniref:3-isopropylmalate dehydratase n=1 Tax=Streptomyces himastatinicus ATCC 53653 TaxID=457427 RepID=D9WCN5_9ACTN|nr:3-isopropylmalate dehydratase, large subunit [Streptomyces himastatinicus ATCC 53653]